MYRHVEQYTDGKFVDILCKHRLVCDDRLHSLCKCPLLQFNRRASGQIVINTMFRIFAQNRMKHFKENMIKLQQTIYKKKSKTCLEFV